MTDDTCPSQGPTECQHQELVADVFEHAWDDGSGVVVGADVRCTACGARFLNAREMRAAGVFTRGDAVRRAALDARPMTPWEQTARFLWALAAGATLADPTCVVGHSCSAAGCPDVARWRSHWPGREPVLQCEHHKAWTAYVADSLGFALHADPVQVRELDPPPPDHTAERFAAMELD